MPPSRLNKDLLTGLLFIALGALGLALGADLPAGSAEEMGSGYHPRLVSVLIVALGSLVALIGLVRRGERPERWRWWERVVAAKPRLPVYWLVSTSLLRAQSCSVVSQSRPIMQLICVLIAAMCRWCSRTLFPRSIRCILSVIT